MELEASSKRGPKRRRVGCSFVINDSAREVTFSKRRQGLFRKAAELSTLCGAEIAIIAYSPHGNPFAFAHPFDPDALIHRYLSGGVTRSVTAEAAAHKKRFEDATMKLQEARRETEKILASGKRSRWWEEAPGDDTEEDELERYVASLERLTTAMSDKVDPFSDWDFYSQLLSTDMKISMEDIDGMFLADLQYSCQLQEARRETEKIVASGERERSGWWEEAPRDDTEKDELDHYVASLERLTTTMSDKVGPFSDRDFYSQLLATDSEISMDMNDVLLADLLYS